MFCGGFERVNKSGAALLVFAVTAVVFFPVLRGEFLNWDDNVLFLENFSFRGFTPENLRWMCTTFFLGHWQPLSWISYALDYAVWGMNPHGWHVANWLLHAVNGALVFLICINCVRRPPGRAGLIAAVFASLFYAVHPLRVEAVAWLSTRGYLLSGTFCLLTVLFYLRAAGRECYPFVALFFFTLAALTKGVCMMLPPVLLLIDWMPLGRITSFRKVVVCGVEKIPFFLLSMLTGVMAFFAKHDAGGMADMDHFGLGDRVVHAIYGMWFYVFKSISPQQLSPLYYKRPDVWAMSFTFALTAVAAVLFFVFRRKLRAVFVVIAVSLLLIFPMIGITQSGVQMFADRFTYLSAVPFSVLIAGLIPGVFRFRRVVIFACAVMVLVFGMQSAVWCQSWQNSLALWESALFVDSGNPRAYNSAGLALKESGQYQRAIHYFDRAIQLSPGYVEAWHNRSIALAFIGEYEDALKGWEIAFSLPDISRQDLARMLWVRGWVLEQGGDLGLALADYSAVIEDRQVALDLRVGVLLLRANLYFKDGQLESALRDAEEILALPDPLEVRHGEARNLIEAVRSR